MGFDLRTQSGVKKLTIPEGDNCDLVQQTLNLLSSWRIGYGEFFAGLAAQVLHHGLPEEPGALFPMPSECDAPPRDTWLTWRDCWWEYTNAAILNDPNEVVAICSRLQRWNLLITPTREVIEELWNAIDQHDDWAPFNSWLTSVSLN